MTWNLPATPTAFWPCAMDASKRLDPSPPMQAALGWIDTHCHLDAAEFDADRSSVIERARCHGVSAMVVPAVDEAGWNRVATLARQTASIRLAYALGVHPMYVDAATEGTLERLASRVRAAMDDERLVAVGEIGLDHFVQGLDRPRQLDFLRAQLRLARTLDLPVILHVRRAQDVVLAEVRRAGVRRGIAHAFNGSPQQASAWVKAGFVLGFGGAMTFPRALRIRQLAASLPLEAIVLETDAPDIAPEWIHRARNEPCQLGAIGAVLGRLRGLEVGDVAQFNRDNALRALPRLAALMGPSVDLGR